MVLLQWLQTYTCIHTQTHTQAVKASYEQHKQTHERDGWEHTRRH